MEENIHIFICKAIYTTSKIQNKWKIAYKFSQYHIYIDDEACFSSLN